MLTDVPGVLSKNGSLIENLSVHEVRELIQDGTIHGYRSQNWKLVFRPLNKGSSCRCSRWQGTACVAAGNFYAAGTWNLNYKKEKLTRPLGQAMDMDQFPKEFSDCLTDHGLQLLYQRQPRDKLPISSFLAIAGAIRTDFCERAYQLLNKSLRPHLELLERPIQILPSGI